MSEVAHATSDHDTIIVTYDYYLFIYCIIIINLLTSQF